MPRLAWGETLRSYREAAGWFVDTCATIPVAVTVATTDEWERVALGVWTVRDLVGHTSRALLTVENYLAAGRDVPGDPAHPPPIDIRSAVDYYGAIDAGVGDPAAVAERGRVAGRDLGAEPAASVARIAARVLAGLDGATGDEVVLTPFGRMLLVDYLPTRTFELVVHGCDLVASLGRPLRVPDAAAAEALRLLGGLAVSRGVAGTLLRSATGRGPLPPDFTVLC